MRFLTWIITLPIMLVAVLFAVSNRETVTFALWPLPFTLEAPIYLATLLALALGFIAGGFVAWNSQRGYRRRSRWQSNRIGYLERDLKEAQAHAAAAEKRLAEMNRPVSGPATAIAAAPAGSALPPPAGATAAQPTVH
ncbi:lipopolysaccharide assembly protein LapA domain-containing protein [Azospirillum sp. SYSU D00513]|uniref:lipopolysaccharide assembly protein LapA domain-containing protein n=1 Tax=Azospirillum sp. SYSU D00513 TaxID=2812561 RepID=UPI001A96401A